MTKSETVSTAEQYVGVTDVFLVGSYNHIEHVKEYLKKDVGAKLALTLAQSNIALAIRQLDRMMERLESN